MRNVIIAVLVVLGLASGVVSAIVYAAKAPAQPPLFEPAPNPYANGIYANGIVESLQSHGANIEIYPRVTGTVVAIPVQEGQTVARGDVLMTLDDAVQRATTEQLKSQADSARALLERMRAEPRPEDLAVAQAQVEQAAASLANTESQLDRLQRAYDVDPRAVSKGTLDDARHTAEIARANLGVVDSQYRLTKAGAWRYDIENQQKTYDAAVSAYRSALAQLDYYTLRAPRDGVVLAIAPALGSYVSPQGTYDTYTQALAPVILMGTGGADLAVRCYVDEILVPKLPETADMRGTMFIRGTNVSVPLVLERIQPFVSPKIQLSNARTERVDVRVLPIIFRFARPEITVFPGQLVDVYIEARQAQGRGAAFTQPEAPAP